LVKDRILREMIIFGGCLILYENYKIIFKGGKIIKEVMENREKMSRV
jgi:hypothetical protein